MMQISAGDLATLKAGNLQVNHLVYMNIGGQLVHITDADYPITKGSFTYLPGYLADDGIDEIEITSDPKINSTDVVLDACDNYFVAAFLGNNWLNGFFQIRKIIHTGVDNTNDVLVEKVAFEGLISSYSIDEENNEVTVTASSVWADFEKQAGIKTNTASQQRYYPTDTAFRHAAYAIKKLYWGREVPGTSGGGVTPPYDPPFEP